jgi:hypothetical protein
MAAKLKIEKRGDEILMRFSRPSRDGNIYLVFGNKSPPQIS